MSTPTQWRTVGSRASNTMELWWVGQDGSVQGAYWYQGDPSGWHRYPLAPAGSAATGAGVTAVSRASNTMELWWVGQDGSVQGAYWYQGDPSGWHRYPLAPGSSAYNHSSITAVSRASNTMELWWIGGDYSVQGAYWYQGDPSGWHRYPLAPALNASWFSRIKAVSRASNTMELWWIALDGSVQVAYWYQGDPSGWNRYQLGPPGALYSSGIAAVSRASNTMEVWWIGYLDSVQDAYSYQ